MRIISSWIAAAMAMAMAMAVAMTKPQSLHLTGKGCTAREERKAAKDFNFIIESIT